MIIEGKQHDSNKADLRRRTGYGVMSSYVDGDWGADSAAVEAGGGRGLGVADPRNEIVC